MRLKVLGAYGASDAEHNLTGYLIDDWFAVDAGTLTSIVCHPCCGALGV